MTTRTHSDSAHGSHHDTDHTNGGPDHLRHRPRRLRRTAAMRALVRETRLSPDNFIYPLFVRTGEGLRREVGSMPGVFQLSVDEAVREAAAAKSDGVPGVLLFGLPDEKDLVGSGAYDPEAPVQAAARAINRKCRGCSSSPMYACVNTRHTAIAASWWMTRSPTMSPLTSSCALRSRTRRPELTWSRLRT